jgi:hypothetical protein
VKKPQTMNPLDEAVEQLGGYFRRIGYARWQNAERLAAEGYRAYKKGDEIRFMAKTKRELSVIRRLLRQAGFKPGRPFTKGALFRQPVYGRQEVARFFQLIGASG